MGGLCQQNECRSSCLMPHMRHLLKKMTSPTVSLKSRKREPVPLKFALCLRPRALQEHRLGYTVIPKELFRGGMSLNQMWVRNRTTKTNGVSYIIQQGAAAVFTEEGQRQIQEGIQVYKKNAKMSDGSTWIGSASGTAEERTLPISG